MTKLLALLALLPAFALAGPWLDATAPGNGCAAVVSGQDATAALQCDIDWLVANHTGGIVQLPYGSFPISATLHLKGGVTLWGAGIRATSIVIATDTTAIALDASVNYGGFRDLWVQCYMQATATQSCVYVDTNVAAILRDAWIWGGNWALETRGVDGLYENLYINGWGSGGGGVKSTGANWYIRDKIDSAPQATNVGFYQGISATGALMENHISQSDFTGPYWISIYVEDGGAGTSVLTIDSSVFSSKISLPHHNTTILNGNELGDPFLYTGNGYLIAVGNRAFPAISVQGPGTARSCAGNVNIAC